MKEKYPLPRWSPLKQGNRKMSRGSRNEGETLRQPSWGDGTRTAQSVSLTTLPDTGWLTPNHTLFAKYQETVQPHRDTHNFVEHAVLKQWLCYKIPGNVWANFCYLNLLPFLLRNGLNAGVRSERLMNANAIYILKWTHILGDSFEFC